MAGRLRFYIVVIALGLLQVWMLVRIPGFPDLMLLTAVFSGIFFGKAEGALTGAVAGFLRGCFSAGVFPFDVFAFSFIGYFSAVLSSFFYKGSPVFQTLASAAASLFLLFSHSLYFHLSGAGMSTQSAFLGSWRYLAVTVFVSPFIFGIFGVLLKLGDKDV